MGLVYDLGKHGVGNEDMMGLILLYIFLSSAVPLSATWAATTAGPIKVTAAPLTLDPTNPDRKSFGKLIFMSGFELASTDARFGGLSGLALSQDGQRLYTVSDHGYWLSASLHHDSQGRLTGMGPWMVASLLATNGKVVQSRQRDAEALVRDRDGSFIVAFERSPRLWRYPSSPNPFAQPPRSLPLPPEIHQAPSNGGLEAVTILLDRRLLLLTEKFKNPDGSVRGWLVDKKRFDPVSYPIANDFFPTDLTTLPNGDLLLLVRQYKWFRGAIVRLLLLPRTSLRPGARLKGKEIIRIGPPLEVDNFEGIAVHQDPKGNIFLYMISDDNYSPLQRTLLLQFRMIDNKP